MWQAVNALERQPAAGRMGAGFGRADGGIKGDEISCPAATGLVMAGPHSEGSPVGALYNGRMVRSCLIELMRVAATTHKEEPPAHAEPRPPLALGTGDSKPHPHPRQLCLGPRIMTISYLLIAGPP